ncbi:methionyl-tRNA formyltransferase [Chloroflexota bacterium]
MRIVFMGTPEFAVPPLEHLLINKYQVTAVYTQPDRPAGRGRSLVSPPVKRVALEFDLPVIQPHSLKAKEVAAQLSSLTPDVIVSAAYGLLLPQAVLDIPKYGCINIHPSLLPAYRGVSPVAATILAGDDFTGVSLILMDRGLDTGPVLGRAAVSISPRDDTRSLTAKLSQVAARLLPEVLAYWLRGKITPQPQDEAVATYSGRINKEDGEIDWQLSAVDIWRRVRAFNPWPGCYTRWQGKQLKIIEAVPLPGEGNITAGMVVRPEQRVAFGISTGDGILGVLKAQAEGKRAMSAVEFLRGHGGLIGAILPSGSEEIT